MKDDVKVRPAEARELEALAQLASAAGFERWDRDALATELDRPWADLLVADADGAVAGFALTWTVVDEGELLFIAVGDAYRRRGIGRGLLETSEERVRGRGGRVMHLEVAARNLGAQALYEALGYGVVGHRPGYYGGSDDAVLMSKGLAD